MYLDKKMNAKPAKGKIVFYNGGVKCDVVFGPCSCGSWHTPRQIFSSADIWRVYIYYLVEKENES